MNTLFLKFNMYRNYSGKKFMNYVFRNRLGKTIWTTRLIIFIMNILDRNQVYVNTGDVDNFDHYVPQLLLNRWRISETGENKNKIFFWSKINKTIKPKSIKKVAGEINWDTSSADGKPSDYISKKLYAEVLEQKASYIIKYVNTNKTPELTFLEESTLSVFVAHQIIRVPNFRKTLNRFLSLGYSKGLISKEELGSKKVLIEKVAKNTINITYDQLDKEKPLFVLKGAKQQESLISLVVADDIAEKIYRTRHLKFLEISEEYENEFVISDNPVVFLDMGRKTILNHIPWWEVGIEKFIIFMPISPKKALLYSPIKDEQDLPIKEFIDLLNFGQYTNCSEGVFSKKETIIQKHLKYYDL
ncbi:MAG: DUF4238 domain-containing protein [Candidatus Paceibacterota bacterium]|jgi:hypothetical protein